ncbi:hypothetical protein V3851_15595 [Paenibacillus sp. M1]|uniref:F0F1-type ATP synthase n=1 Tax=Paenibacillus haidiansis TaxID=1574488 RepID=A0ABU7VVL9_9BACL
MKITDWAIIFVLIAGPLIWISGWNTEQAKEANRLQIEYTAALRTAAQDSGAALNLNELQAKETGYGSDKFMRADKAEALKALLNTLALNFGIADDPLALRTFMLYIPAVVVVDYDGYSIYALVETAGEDGTPLVEHRWRPKKPYVYMDGEGNSLSFTFDSRITAIDGITGSETTGLREELAAGLHIPLLQDEAVFDRVRRSVIVRSIEDDLAGTINRHNTLARRLGVNYTFTLPLIPQEEWNNTIDDTGVLVFLQGIPVGNRYYNNYALGGGRLVKGRPVYGGTDPSTGIKYTFGGNCVWTGEAEEVFASAKDAAAAGYFEKSCLQTTP